MQPTIRAFTPTDYPAITAVHNTVYPDYPQTPDEFRYWDEHREPHCRAARWVAEQNGAIVAAGSYEQWAFQYHPRKFAFDLWVVPERQAKGIGKRLYEQLLAALAPFDPLSIRTHARENLDRSRHFLEARGFRPGMAEWESRLDLAAFDPARYAGGEERVMAQGIELRSLKELEHDPERDRKVWELDWAVTQDVPSDEPATRVSFEHFLTSQMQHPNFLPDAYFVAVDGEHYVGLSTLWKCQGSPDLDTGLTGVRREYRRRGIALALKNRALTWAKAAGRPQVKTWNATSNEGMLGINVQLGFARQPAWIEWTKTLAEE